MSQKWSIPCYGESFFQCQEKQQKIVNREAVFQESDTRKWGCSFFLIHGKTSGRAPQSCWSLSNPLVSLSSPAECWCLWEAWPREKVLAINWLTLKADPARWPEGVQVSGKVPVHFFELWPRATTGLCGVMLVLLCIHPAVGLCVSGPMIVLEYCSVCDRAPSRAVKARTQTLLYNLSCLCTNITSVSLVWRLTSCWCWCCHSVVHHSMYPVLWEPPFI